MSPTEWSFCQVLITGPGLGSFHAFSLVLATLGALATGPGMSVHFCRTYSHFLALSVQFHSESCVAKNTGPATFPIYPENHIHTHRNYIYIQLHILSCSCILTAATHFDSGFGSDEIPSCTLPALLL